MHLIKTHTPENLYKTVHELVVAAQQLAYAAYAPINVKPGGGARGI